MSFDFYSSTDAAILRAIGQKVKEMRVAKNLTQAQVVQRCGLSSYSISQIETGHNANMLSLIMLLRGMDALDLLQPFVQTNPINPIAIVDYQKKHPARKRAKGNNNFNIESEW